MLTDKEKKIEEAFKTDYPLIPMKDITDEARMIAVDWMECEENSWIKQKHKLASDIMNYARRNPPDPKGNASAEEQEELWEDIDEIKEDQSPYAALLHIKHNYKLLKKN
jgi:hypothetical protein